jgi:glycerophosphoryl diester phosphodiesterase
MVWAIFLPGDFLRLMKKRIAHRGNTIGPHHPDFPENTLVAFEQAIAVGADMIETDVRMTRDRVLVIHHDPTVDGKAIAQLTWAELQIINPIIPTLEATIDCCRQRIGLDLEIKMLGYEAEVLAATLAHFAIDDFVITSFDDRVLHRIRQLNAQVRIGLLIKNSIVNQLLPWLIQCRIDRLQPDFIAPHYSLFGKDWFQRIASNLPYWLWTVNDPSQQTELRKKPNVEAIITDYHSYR